MLHNFLSRPLSFLGWTTMLFWLDFHHAQIKPLQMIQNAAARLVFKRAHVTPLFISLHWLPVASRIKFKTLMLAYRTTTASAPAYFHWLIRVYIPSKSLRSTSERHLVVPSQRGSKSFSRTFSFTVPGWWNDLPTPIQNAESLTIFKRQLKTHLFQHYLIYSFLACTNLNNAWNLVLVKSSQVKLSFIVIPLHVGTYSGTKCRASRVHGAT